MTRSWTATCAGAMPVFIAVPDRRGEGALRDRRSTSATGSSGTPAISRSASPPTASSPSRRTSISRIRTRRRCIAATPTATSADPDAVIALERRRSTRCARSRRPTPARLAVMGICQTGRLPLWSLASARPIGAALVWYGAAQPREWAVNSQVSAPARRHHRRGRLPGARHVRRDRPSDFDRRRPALSRLPGAPPQEPTASMSTATRRTAGSTTPCRAATAAPRRRRPGPHQLAFLDAGAGAGYDRPTRIQRYAADIARRLRLQPQCAARIGIGQRTARVERSDFLGHLVFVGHDQPPLARPPGRRRPNGDFVTCVTHEPFIPPQRRPVLEPPPNGNRPSDEERVKLTDGRPT